MILTVTANPTIDRVLFVRDFAMQDVVRAEREVVSPSGKGIDVSMILHELGAATLAITLNAGLSGDMLAELLAQRGIPCHFIPAEGETRVASLITDLANGRQSTILAPTLTAGPQPLPPRSPQARNIWRRWLPR
jgi:fructose-1-phosphate kinase PfkB-like protein